LIFAPPGLKEDKFQLRAGLNKKFSGYNPRSTSLFDYMDHKQHGPMPGSAEAAASSFKVASFLGSNVDLCDVSLGHGAIDVKAVDAEAVRHVVRG